MQFVSQKRGWLLGAAACGTNKHKALKHISTLTCVHAGPQTGVDVSSIIAHGRFGGLPFTHLFGCKDSVHAGPHSPESAIGVGVPSREGTGAEGVSLTAPGHAHSSEACSAGGDSHALRGRDAHTLSSSLRLLHRRQPRTLPRVDSGGSTASAAVQEADTRSPDAAAAEPDGGEASAGVHTCMLRSLCSSMLSGGVVNHGVDAWVFGAICRLVLSFLVCMALRLYYLLEMPWYCARHFVICPTG